MKSAAKAFLIIGMVLTFYLIYPIVLGIFALKAIDKAKTHNDLTAWAIVSMIFVSLFGGLFMLFIKDEELEGFVRQQPEARNANTEKSYDVESVFELEDENILNTSSAANDKYDASVATAQSVEANEICKMNGGISEDDIVTAEIYDEL